MHCQTDTNKTEYITVLMGTTSANDMNSVSSKLEKLFALQIKTTYNYEIQNID